MSLSTSHFNPFLFRHHDPKLCNSVTGNHWLLNLNCSIPSIMSTENKEISSNFVRYHLRNLWLEREWTILFQNKNLKFEWMKVSKDSLPKSTEIFTQNNQQLICCYYQLVVRCFFDFSNAENAPFPPIGFAIHLWFNYQLNGQSAHHWHKFKCSKIDLRPKRVFLLPSIQNGSCIDCLYLLNLHVQINMAVPKQIEREKKRKIETTKEKLR